MHFLNIAEKKYVEICKNVCVFITDKQLNCNITMITYFILELGAKYFMAKITIPILSTIYQLKIIKEIFSSFCFLHDIYLLHIANSSAD